MSDVHPLPSQRVREIFNNALDRPEHERPHYLDRECGGEQGLRASVEELLKNHKEDDFLEEVAEAMQPHDQAEKAIGSTIDKYKLLKVIGRGGGGVVYLAEEKNHIHRKVALKIIRPEIASKKMVARFKVEGQALASLEHSNIAKIYTAGIYTAGTTTHPKEMPFLVMELVRGTRITDYCDTHQLTLKERLDLFSKVCQAIQHAHDKGVIHRDIKPSNILVAEENEEPLPKIIDFGIARSVLAEQADETPVTITGQIIGTLAYMSPEQAEASQHEIDCRTDVYSLGVLLYELLIGCAPFDLNGLSQYAQLRTVIDEAPQKPSAKFAALTETEQATIARLRHTTPPELRLSLESGLDCIVMKCLEKERDQRFRTAENLANKIQKYLAPSNPGKPQSPLSAIKWWLALAGVVVLVPAMGLGGWYWGKQQTTNESLKDKLAAKEQELKTQKDSADKTLNTERQQWATSKAKLESDLQNSQQEAKTQTEARRKAEDAAAALTAEKTRLEANQKAQEAAYKKKADGDATALAEEKRRADDAQQLLADQKTQEEENKKTVEAEQQQLLAEKAKMTADLFKSQQEAKMQTEARRKAEAEASALTAEMQRLVTDQKTQEVESKKKAESDATALVDERRKADDALKLLAEQKAQETAYKEKAEAERIQLVNEKASLEANLSKLQQEAKLKIDAQPKVEGDATALAKAKNQADEAQKQLAELRAREEEHKNAVQTELRRVAEEKTKIETDKRQWETEKAALESEISKLREQANSTNKPAQTSERWTNSFGMTFVSIPGTKVLFCIWDVRVQDYQKYADGNAVVDDKWIAPGFKQSGTHPVVNVNWYDAKSFYKWLTLTEHTSGILPANKEYRLPTDEEWSIAVGIGEREDSGAPRDKNGKLMSVWPWGKAWPPPKGTGNYAQSLDVDTYVCTSPVGSVSGQSKPATRGQN